MATSALNARKMLVERMAEMRETGDRVASLEDLREQVAALPDGHPALAAYAEALGDYPMLYMSSYITRCARRGGGAESLLANLMKGLDAMYERGRVLAARPDIKEIIASHDFLTLRWRGDKGGLCVWKRGGPSPNHAPVHMSSEGEARSLHLYLTRPCWRDAPSACA